MNSAETLQTKAVITHSIQRHLFIHIHLNLSTQITYMSTLTNLPSTDCSSSRAILNGKPKAKFDISVAPFSQHRYLTAIKKASFAFECPLPNPHALRYGRTIVFGKSIAFRFCNHRIKPKRSVNGCNENLLLFVDLLICFLKFLLLFPLLMVITRMFHLHRMHAIDLLYSVWCLCVLWRKQKTNTGTSYGNL